MDVADKGLNKVQEPFCGLPGRHDVRCQNKHWNCEQDEGLYAGDNLLDRQNWIDVRKIIEQDRQWCHDHGQQHWKIQQQERHHDGH